MFYLAGICPICGAGVLGFRLCSDGATIVVMCDECDAIWLDARQLDRALAMSTEPPEFQVPGLSCSISSPRARWAKKPELEAAGWDDLIAGEWQAFDERRKR